MSWNDRGESVDVEVEEVVKTTAKAILVLVEGEEYWIPRSQIEGDFATAKEGDSGTMIIPQWLADQEGLG